MDYNDRMVATLLADHERWTAREAAEIASRKDRSVVDPYCRDRGITGEPSNKNRTHKATENSWSRAERRRVQTRTEHADGRVTVGSKPFGNSTVKVTRDGKTTYLPAAAFRKERQTMARDATLHSIDRQNRLDEHRRINAADLDAAQDYENDN
jgi:hypothetical protein